MNNKPKITLTRVTTRRRFRKNLMTHNSVKCLNPYIEATENSKLVIMQFSDSFLCKISSSTDSNRVKFVTHNLKVSRRRHAFKCLYAHNISNIVCIKIYDLCEHKISYASF